MQDRYRQFFLTRFLMDRYKKVFYLVLVTTIVNATNSSLFAQSISSPLEIKKITSNVNVYSDSFVKIVGSASNIQNNALTRGHIFLTRFTITDRSGSINVIGNIFSLQDNDSLSIIGKFVKERKYGNYIAAENEIDATVGEIEVLTSGYKQQQEEDKRAQDSLNQKVEAGTADPEEMGVPSYIIDTPSTKMVTYATILGALFTILTAIPLLTRRRRFNIDMKVILLQPPKIIRNNIEGSKSICIELKLHNLKLLPPEISSQILFKVGDVNLMPSVINSTEYSEVRFPLRLERSVPLSFHFDYDSFIQYFAGSDYFSIQFKDEFCSKTFSKKFNFIIPSESEDTVDTLP